jgi:flagellar basal-body rod protein FlgG
MNVAMYKALSGAIAQMRRLEVVSENLANVKTVGHKGGHIAFTEVLADVAQQKKDRPGGLVAVGEQRTDFSQGMMQQTENPLDLAIDGDGFFAIDTPRGIRYTRQGSFTRAADGMITTPMGDVLLGENGPIQVSGKDLQITANGQVMAEGVPIDKIQVVQFSDPRVLEKEGYALFRAPAGAGQPAAQVGDSVRVLQGYVEEANVTPIDALVSLINTQRQFEVYVRAMKTMDATTEKVLNETARV